VCDECDSSLIVATSCNTDGSAGYSGALFLIRVSGIRKEEAMAQVQNGDTVKVHYEGRLDDGTPFASSIDGEPATVTIGSHALIPTFEEAIIGMEPSESKTLAVPANDAFGRYRDDLVKAISRQALALEEAPEIGQRLDAIDPNGKHVTVMITDVSEETITIDANHPLAGEDLVFDILLVEIC